MQDNKQEIELFCSKIEYNSDSTILFNTLCNKRSSTLLLEYSKINKSNPIESIIIIDSALRITSKKKIINLKALSKNGFSLLLLFKKKIPNTVILKKYPNSCECIFPENTKNIEEDVKLRTLSIFDCFRILLKLIKKPKQESKAMFIGGLFSYDLIYEFENLPSVKSNQKCPNLCFYLAETLMIINHKKKTSKLQCSLFNYIKTEKQRINLRLEQLKKKIKNIKSIIPCKKINTMKLTCNLNDNEYNKIVHKMKKAIYEGEIFQIVPSRKFFLPCPFPLAAYKKLKKNNPSPYMFFMQDQKFILFGSSPESSLKYNNINNNIELCPIAGTKTRGIIKGKLDLDVDNRIESEMRTNNKEISEHLMLVDLARNDLARICIPGSRYVAELTKIVRYSFVMHLVSKVIGKLRYDLDMLHAYSACMNMGTLTGVPKLRAMQLIAETEGEKRGSYGGSIGYFTSDGNFDTCIVIRSVYIENGVATIQAGSGIVLDSSPKAETQENRNKAHAALNAIITSHSVKELLYG